MLLALSILAILALLGIGVALAWFVGSRRPVPSGELARSLGFALVEGEATTDLAAPGARVRMSGRHEGRRVELQVDPDATRLTLDVPDLVRLEAIPDWCADRLRPRLGLPRVATGDRALDTDMGVFTDDAGFAPHIVPELRELGLLDVALEINRGRLVVYAVFGPRSLAKTAPQLLPVLAEIARRLDEGAAKVAARTRAAS